MTMITYVLATVGRTAEVVRCLRTLRDQSDNRLEVIVVDQNIDDRLRPVIEAFTHQLPHFSWIRQDAPNLSKARNRAIALAKGSWIAFADDDGWYESDFNERALEKVRTSELEVVLVNWTEKTLNEGWYNEAKSSKVLLSEARRFQGPSISSINLIIRTDFIRKIDGFDSRFGVGQRFGAGEETDLMLRALSEGAEVGYCVQARVHHNFANSREAGAVDLKTWLGRVRSRSRGTGALYRKHRIDWRISVRGFIAPFIKGVLCLNLAMLIEGYQVSAGRLEGFLSWSGSAQLDRSFGSEL